MYQGDALGFSGEEVVVIVRGDELQKLPRAGDGELGVAEDDERGEVQILVRLAERKLAPEPRALEPAPQSPEPQLLSHAPWSLFSTKRSRREEEPAHHNWRTASARH